MSLYRISTFMAYNEDQGAFMIFNEITSNLETVPVHYITEARINQTNIEIICATKHLTKTFEVSSTNPESDLEQINFIISNFS
jgi:hypothetical protein